MLYVFCCVVAVVVVLCADVLLCVCVRYVVLGGVTLCVFGCVAYYVVIVCCVCVSVYQYVPYFIICFVV